MRSLVLALLLTGCGVYNANRAALVPTAVPRMTTGQPSPGIAQLDLGASSVTSFQNPKPGQDNIGIEVPGTQLHGGLKLQPNETVSIGVLYENGLDRGAQQLNNSQPPVDGGSVTGYGLSLDFTIKTGDPRFKVGLGFDAMVWSAPYVEYAACAAGEECFPFLVMAEGRDSFESFAASIVPSFKTSPNLTVFGGVTVRNHPTLEQKVETSGPLFDDVEIDSGPANFIISGGVEFSLADGALLASAIAYWDISQTPVKYGPGMAMMVSIPLGKRDKPQPPMLINPGPYAPGAPPPGTYPPPPTYTPPPTYAPPPPYVPPPPPPVEPPPAPPE